jgi:formylglycine-generating enzyme required for sulfatase activity
MADIFFSYKREDRASVEPLVRLFEGEGFSVWWDPTLVAGELYDQVISREIEKASCVIAAWSASSVHAVWVRDEAMSGRDRGVLVPLSLDGVRPPLGFRQFQTPDLSGWAGNRDDPRIRQLIAGVSRLVRDSRAPSPSEPDGSPVVAQAQDQTAGEVRKPVWEAGSPAQSEPSAKAWHGTNYASRMHMPSRRRLLQLGLAAGALGLAFGSVFFGLPSRRGGGLPATRSEKFDLITVDERGGLRPAQRQAVDVFEVPLAEGHGMEFSLIPAGGFQIGSPDDESQRRPNEGPQQFVEIRTFALGRTTITQAQWAAVVEAAPETIEQTLSPYPSFFRGDRLPVETISWDQAVEFCRRLSKVTGLNCRLPSEAEWEYACRARTTSPFHFGATLTPELANYCGTGGAVCGMNEGKDISSETYDGVPYPSGAYGKGPEGEFRNGTVEAGSFPPNRFGLFQMHGNVWEHCLDTGLADYRHIPTDGSPHVGPQSRRVLRGGSWSHNPAICRSAYRDSMLAHSVGWQGRVGLRVACDL